MDVERGRLKEATNNLFERAGSDDCDGEGGLAVKPDTAEIAGSFIDSVPSDPPAPYVAATPHGEIDFDRALERAVMVTMSFNERGATALAAIFGNARLGGLKPWTGAMPAFAMLYFERLKGYLQ